MIFHLFSNAAFVYLPILIAVWLMFLIEKKLHKIVSEIIDLFVTPLATVLVTGYVTFTIICGAFYALTVVAGLHHMYNTIEIGLISQTELNIWMPIATAEGKVSYQEVNVMKYGDIAAEEKAIVVK